MATVDKTIPDHFRGILCRGIKNYTVEEEVAAKDTLFEGRAKEELLPGEVLIRVTRCGICAGDAKVSTLLKRIHFTQQLVSSAGVVHPCFGVMRLESLM